MIEDGIFALGRKQMIRGALIIAIAVLHAAGFVLTYYGRCRGVPACDSEFVLFALPFGLAIAAYAAILVATLTLRNGAKRLLLSLALATGLSVMSELVGMTIAFNLMGT